MSRRTFVAIALGAVLVTAATALAQQDFLRGFGRRGRGEARAVETTNVPYDGRFTFVRLRYNVGFRGGRGGWDAPWAHDYPRAEKNFMKILKEISLVSPYMDGGNVLALDDPDLSNFPVAYMSEPGFWTLSDTEAAALRAYLLKGGFVIFDDFRGFHWENFREQVARVLPEIQLVELDVQHAIFHSFFEIASLEFVQFYDRGERPVFYGAFEDNDPKKRLLLVANYNNDIGEYWEFSDTGFVPIDLSNEAYKLGVNYVVYAMTH